MADPKYVLIDTDAGSDDALALWMLLAAHKHPNHELTIVGITCCNGNTAVKNVGVNVNRILAAVSEPQIPVYLGTETPILDPWVFRDGPFHGLDGFGDRTDLGPVNPIIQTEHGVSAIIRLAYEYQGRLSIVALGPLTNLAMAVRMDPRIKTFVKDIYIMGGNIEGEGNTTVSGEFNFVVDPEAAYITLSSYFCPIVIAPWEVCKRESLPIQWRVEQLGSLGTPQMNILNKVEEKILIGTDVWIPCDQLAAAALIEPDVAHKKALVRKHCTVELHGRHTRGLMILDHNRILEQPENVTIITDIDSDMFRKMLLWGGGGPYYKD